MTKKLESLFNLPDVDTDTTSEQDIEHKQEMLDSADQIIDRIDQALPQVRELDGADGELDELAKLAKDKFVDLMDLGMNVEARYSGQILQTAGILLGHAITAKQAKIDKKLRMVDLQLKKLRLDQSAAKEGTNSPSPIEGQAVVLDRNELLKQILADSKQPKNTE
jgi:hypothetical protein